ncbi:MAG: exodeoxyribonuclease VII large subunit [Patescibacteria group bacterium]
MQLMTVSEFITFLNETFKAIWDSSLVAIEGEVAEFKVSQGQWVNFNLKDDQSMVSAFMVYAKLGVPLQDGMRVRVFGYPRVYPKYGKFSFSVERIELVGEGSLRKALALLHQKLEAEGLFDPSRKRELPRFPKRIALVASRESAAYGDFIRILHERWRGLEVDVYHVLVQGESAPESIVRAIERANEKALPLSEGEVEGVGARSRYDALVLTRGGGSLEELMAFNDERVVRAIHASRIPTLVGIGHERDLTFAEEAADVRGSTPTDCARRLVPDREDVLFEIAQQERAVEERLLRWMEEWSRRADHALDAAMRWAQTVSERFAHAHTRLDESVDRWLITWQDRLTSTERLLRSLDPSAVLRRGYAIVLDQKTGAPRTSVIGLAVGDALRVRLKDGVVDTRVTGLGGQESAPRQDSLL